jgi:endogenous inhibitor of DNA gyrase (YacG/DUF329 family)
VPTSSKQFCCSSRCMGERKKHNRIKIMCLYCGKDIYELKKRSGSRKYCSTKCKISALAENRRQRYKDKRVFGKWTDYKELKKYLINKHKSCQKCGWRDEIGVLEGHHIDENRKNNKEENLLLLCPNCHSIEHYKNKTGQFKNNLGKKYATNNQRSEINKKI